MLPHAMAGFAGHTVRPHAKDGPARGHDALCLCAPTNPTFSACRSADEMLTRCCLGLAVADLDAVQFFHKQGFRPVEDANYADVTARLAAHGVVEPTPSRLMCTSVENQLFVGQVREAEAQAQALGPELIGQRVEVYWSGENVWFPGHVAAYRAQERIHYVVYDDGESVWERLTAKDCKARGPGPARAQLDTTVCAICNGNGTAGPLYGPFDSNRRKDLYVHEHCIMFNSCVRLVGGALRGVGDVIATAKKATCKRCRKKGASVTCAHDGCKAAYHYECCKSDESCHFQSEQYEFYCPGHTSRARRKDTRRAGGSEENDTESSAEESTAQYRSMFGTASCEMLAPAAFSDTAAATASSAALAQAQNNGTNGGWTLSEDRCLAAIMDAAKQTPARAKSDRPTAKYSWSQISVVIARLVDSACKRSENSCRHRWNKIAGVYKPTAEEKRRAQKFLELPASDEGDRPASSTAKQSGSVGRDSYDGGDIAVRQCQQKVIVAGDDEGSDADNDVVEVVSVGADIKRLPELPPGYVRASARPAPGTTARDGKQEDSTSDTLPAKRRTTSAATAARSGNRARRSVAPPHPPAAIVRSPAQHLKGRAETGKCIRRSGGINGREVRIHMVGSGGNCRICRNGRGVCRKRGAPGHLEAEQPEEKPNDDDGDDDQSSSEQGNDEEDSDGTDRPERPKTRRRSNGR